jgi:hypothetical protein
MFKIVCCLLTTRMCTQYKLELKRCIRLSPQKIHANFKLKVLNNVLNSIVMIKKLHGK